MKRIDFSTGDEVVTIKDGELRKGVIKNFFPVDPPIFIIEFEDGTIEKVRYDKVAPAPKTETQEPEEKNEPVVKSEITITPDEFMNITARVVAKETKGDLIVGMAFARLFGKVYKALFVEPWENE